MRNFICDGSKCISDFQKSGPAGQLVLKWRQRDSSISKYLLVFAPDRASATITDNYALQDFINKGLETLLHEGVISNEKWIVKMVNFGEVFRGGVHIPDLPGCYAVYSVDDFNVYYESNPIIISVSVRLEYSVEKYMNEVRHLFRKSESVYSGYNKITIHNGIKGIAPASVRYRWGDGRGNFPVPKNIIENGGSFFVSLEEDDRIDIYSLYDGIEITKK